MLCADAQAVAAVVWGDGGGYDRVDMSETSDLAQKLQPGARVRVVQQIAARHYALPTEVRGTVVRYEQRPTGSWYAHSRNDKLWLDRLLIRKDDGELVTLNLDQFTRVEVEPQAVAS